jgi:hypothetical protein
MLARRQWLLLTMVLTMAASNHVDIPEPDPERYAPSGNGLSTDEALLLDALMGAHDTYFIPGTDEHDAHEAEIAAAASAEILDGLSAEGLSAPNPTPNSFNDPFATSVGTPTAGPTASPTAAEPTAAPTKSPTVAPFTGKCECDPLLHFSQHTTCTATKNRFGLVALVVHYHAHQMCHPLDPEFVACNNANVSAGAAFVVLRSCFLADESTPFAAGTLHRAALRRSPL